ncbi:MAG: DNA adenine methylase [Spirochaetaceae bacterium]|nr:DNA adenine methylase [Spirochaetaceae bacterium]
MSQLGLFTSQAGSPLSRAFDEFGAVTLHNRKYLGSKVRLLDFIEREILSAAGDVGSFFDGFAGTGVVADRMRSHTSRLTLVDNLASNYSINRAFFTSSEADVRLAYVADALRELNQLEPAHGYAREHYGGRYFTHDNAGRIDAIRDRIALRMRDRDCTEQEQHVLIASLLLAADKVANTVGQYDAYLKNLGSRTYDENGRHLVDANVYAPLRLRMPVLRFAAGATVLRADVNEVAADHEADVAYLDPPYNDRQYVDCYHVLENIARWTKPPLHGKTRKFERDALKSDYSRRRTALAAFAQLVDRIRARYIVVSYSNEGLLSVADLKATLETRGPTTIASSDYAVFGNGAGQSVRRRVVEYLAICRADGVDK